MTERVARMAEPDDEKYELYERPTIESVTTLTKKVVKDSNNDVFAQDGEFVKTLKGSTPAFKRRVTNELKKYNRSADKETESKQIEDSAVVDGYDAFGVIMPPHSLEGLAEIYKLSAPHYSAVNAKVSNIVGLGYKLVETTKTKRLLEDAEGNEQKLKAARKKLDKHRDELYELIESFNEEETFTEVLVKVWRDYEVTGNGYIEIGRKADGTIGYVGHIPSDSVRVRRDRDGFVQISANKAQFFRNFGDDIANPIGTDNNPNELIHIKRYAPGSGGYYGVPDIVAAQYAIAGMKFSADYNLDYFENKAVPRHLITLKGANLGSSAQADLLSFFETGLKGQHHRSLFIPLPGDDGINKVEFDIEAIENGKQDSSFKDFHNQNINEILMAHRVPITKVSASIGGSLALARDADKTFKEQVCGPEQGVAEKKVNRIIKEFTDAFEFELNEMTLTDADTQSKIDERMVKTGVWTANEIRARDGMPALKGGEERVDLNAKDKIAEAAAEAKTVRERDSARSANSSDSSGESRQPKGDGRAQG